MAETFSIPFQRTFENLNVSAVMKFALNSNDKKGVEHESPVPFGQRCTKIDNFLLWCK